MRKILTSTAFILIASFAVVTTTPASAFGPKDIINGDGGGGGGGGGFKDKDLGWNPDKGDKPNKGGKGKHWHNGHHGLGFGLTLNFAPASQAYKSSWGDHVDWCVDRYKTYNPSNNLYMSKHGPRECVSPYL